MSLNDYLNNKPVLTTKNLILRSMTKDDVESLLEWMPDISLYDYWGKKPGKADKNPELLFACSNKPTKSFHWGIALKQTDKIIGEIWAYLIENDRMAKVAFRI